MPPRPSSFAISYPPSFSGTSTPAGAAWVWPAAVAAAPREGAVTSGPAEGAVTSGPAEGAVTSGPAEGAVTSGPADGAVTSGPAEGAVTSGLAEGAVTSGPAEGIVASAGGGGGGVFFAGGRAGGALDGSVASTGCAGRAGFGGGVAAAGGAACLTTIAAFGSVGTVNENAMPQCGHLGVYRPGLAPFTSIFAWQLGHVIATSSPSLLRLRRHRRRKWLILQTSVKCPATEVNRILTRPGRPDRASAENRRKSQPFPDNRTAEASVWVRNVIRCA